MESVHATPVARRRFLKFAAMTAAGAVVTACSGNAPSQSSQPTQAAGATAAPASSSGAAPSPTAAKITVSEAQSTVAPTAAAATTPAAGAAASASPAANATAAPKSYKEAPELAALVKAGSLPPVEQRLPDNPRVITPLGQVGQYGGTWHRAYSGLSDRWGPTKLMEDHQTRWWAPDPNTIQVVPNFSEKWEQSSDATEFTFHFRKGLKWSDGKEVTTDDSKFWYEDMELNKDLKPTPDGVIYQKTKDGYQVAQASFPDKYTVKIKYADPFPLLPIIMAKSGGGLLAMPSFVAPSHYLKQFHAKYTDQSKLDALAKQKGLTSWTDLWGKAGDWQGPIAFWLLNPDLPVVTAWKIKTPPPKDPMVMVRNPYYWQVDTEGNQLPYIGQINHALFQNTQVLNLWIASAKIDAQTRHLSAGDWTFYKENEKKGNYKTLRWRAASTNCYYVSLNAPDPVLAKLFDQADFRQALNLAINRDELNQVVWNGLGTARQYSPVRGSPSYDEEMSKMWTKYDPKAANNLLDKLGLKMGSNGVRLRPDGKPLEFVMEHTALQGSPDIDAHNLVQKYWAAIGVKIDLKYDERALYEQQVHNAAVTSTAGFGWDRSSVVKADPGRFLGTIDDGPWAPAYGHWYAKSPYKQIEPPKDHPIRKIWSFWDQTQVEPDEAKRNALFKQLLDIHKQHPYAMGTVGEMAAPMIVRNNFHNIPDGYILDDTLRGIGLIYPDQCWISK